MAKTFPVKPERMSREEQAPALNGFKMEASWTGLGLWKGGLRGGGCRKVLGAGLGRADQSHNASAWGKSLFLGR